MGGWCEKKKEVGRPCENKSFNLLWKVVSFFRKNRVYVLLQKLEVSDDGKRLALALRSIDDADDGKYENADIHYYREDRNKTTKEEADGIEYFSQDAHSDIAANAGNKEDEALIGVVACELRLGCCEDGNEHEDA